MSTSATSVADEHGAAAAAVEGTTHRDRQRRALGDLVALARQCATTESQIEQRFGTIVEENDRELEKTTWAIEQRHQMAVEALERERQERLARAATQFESDLAALKQAEQSARKRIEHDHNVAEQDVKNKFQQAAWLAESVCEATQAQAREEFKVLSEKVSEDLEKLEQIERSAQSLMMLYLGMVPQVAAAEPPPPKDPDKAYAEQAELAERRRQAIADLRLPRLFVGIRPLLLLSTLCILAATAAQFWAGGPELQLKPVGIATGSTLAAAMVIGLVLWLVGRSQVRKAWVPFVQAMTAARAAADARLAHGRAQRDRRLAEAEATRADEEKAAREKFQPLLAKAAHRRDTSLAAVMAEYSKQLPRLESARDQHKADIEKWYKRRREELDNRRATELELARQKHHSILAEAQERHREGRLALERRLQEGLAGIHAPMGNGAVDGEPADWDEDRWASWTPPRRFPPGVRFGQLHVDLKRIATSVPGGGQVQLALPEPFETPVLLEFPRQASLLIQSQRGGRDGAIRILQMVMARLLTSLPPGRVRFTIVDPVGLGQNFAGFMHLADHDDALVGGRIWTEEEHIEQRLADLTEHMETVIQKYLRNEFETIDEYNAQAGELAEPYRFLVVADFPVGFNDEALKRLSSIVSSGARCGVYTLIMYDRRQPLPAGTHLEELEAHSVNLVEENGGFQWKDPVFSQFPLALDAPPGETLLTRLLDVVGREAKEARRVEVPFEAIAPAPEQIWSRTTLDELSVPMGRMGATRLQSLTLGRGVAQHVLLAGKTGSGKSTLLHVLVTNLALWYPPQEVEFYLVDFKKGVEFKTYAANVLPHARAVAIESDREFGLSVLHRLDAELTRRGELFRQLGVQDLPSYRRESGQPLPRTLLIIDEFQEFFSEDDRLAQDAALLLDRLVRQGRAFGIHVLLGSQTIGGTSGLARSTIGQMAVRIALQCSEADSQLILGDNNSAARLLSRPGEAIYNDAGGLVEANSPFQVSWLPDDQREQYLEQVRRRARELPPLEPPVVFEGNAPADIARNRRLTALLEASDWPRSIAAPQAWLGEPVAIKEPTHVTYRRLSGANTIIVGQFDESAMAIMMAMVVSLAAQHRPEAAVFYLLDGTPADSSLHGALPRLAQIVPHELRQVEWRAVGEAMAELAAEVTRRQAEDHGAAPEIYVLIYGLQRYRVLRKQEESFAFTTSEENKSPAPDRLFADILREGPALGIHVIAWADTPATVERTLDRNSLREFDTRVLFQMSANDSSNLIDSPLANKLGLHRALAYSEEQGVMEKFRPYALPSAHWLQRVAQSLRRRAGR